MIQSDEYIPLDLKPGIILFRRTGIWPPVQKSHLYKWSSLMWLLLVVIPFPLTLFVNLFYATSTVQEIVDHFLLSTTALNCTYKVIYMYLQQTNIRNVFELHDTMLKKSNNKFDDADEFNRVKRYNQLIFKYFEWFYFSCGFAIVLQVAFAKPEKRVWPSTYNLPSEMLKGPELYLIGLIYQGFCNMMIILWGVPLDTFPVILMCMLSGHVDRLCTRLRQLGIEFHDEDDDSDDNVEEAKLSPNDRYYRDLKDCSQYYELCSRYALNTHFESSINLN